MGERSHYQYFRQYEQKVNLLTPHEKEKVKRHTDRIAEKYYLRFGTTTEVSEKIMDKILARRRRLG
jgi:hypothetical protein